MSGSTNVVRLPALRQSRTDLKRELAELCDRARLAAVENATIARRLAEILKDDDLKGAV